MTPRRRAIDAGRRHSGTRLLRAAVQHGVRRKGRTRPALRVSWRAGCGSPCANPRGRGVADAGWSSSS
eukprot:10153719-Alexandrium_andersonii.AAC.1